ncbi:MAG: hypothetical protein BWZ10_01187 [candidate division BRC1 bacterium ADurb.BinA364]|nr:MAG: hypothetical protein BWZ10_01187 [candidate division BRC1 bacterium ADurb.BinA364]
MERPRMHAAGRGAGALFFAGKVFHGQGSKGALGGRTMPKKGRSAANTHRIIPLL